jgi:hypothetical protein
MLKKILFVLAVSMVPSVTAFAASPKPGASYRGTGKDYLNNAPTWTDESTGRISFVTSADGAAVTHFKGTYYYYCGAGTADVTETRMPVSKSGRFGTKFSQKTKGPTGAVTGTAYVSISGRFEKGGSKASVSYLVDVVFTGGHVSHPYSTRHPKALGCASWVRGTVKAQ